jgi:hypothetical protein
VNSLATALVVFGVIGYLILRHFCYRTGFRWETLEWQQNVFESTGFGLLLFGLARLLGPPVHSLTGASPATSQAQRYIAERLPFPFPGTVILGTLLGLLIAWGVNLIWPKDKALERVVINHGGRLRILLHDASKDDRPVMLTLTNRKVYVGAVAVPPPLREPSHVVIFPTVSGFRHEDNLEIEWTAKYSPAYVEIIKAFERGEDQRTDLQHFQLVIPLSAILSATYFDFEIWERHFETKGKNPPPKPTAG